MTPDSKLEKLPPRTPDSSSLSEAETWTENRQITLKNHLTTNNLC